VFLRVLEYYQGILILTTNQIAQFDVAVQSRIHLAIKYKGLDKGQTIAIFTEFLRQYDSHGLVEDLDECVEYAEDDLWRKKFDGRQIRNIVTSAMGIARDEGKKLTYKHITKVVSRMEDFKGDLEYQMMQYTGESTALSDLG
jgi:AAA+ superfamily predicted ATPase